MFKFYLFCFFAFIDTCIIAQFKPYRRDGSEGYRNDVVDYYNITGFPFVQNYYKTDYGAGTSNWYIDQDGRNILYVANELGLLEYNGTSWKMVFVPDDKSIIKSIAIKNDTLYVGTQGEFGYLIRDKNDQFHYKKLSSDIDPLILSDVWSINIVSDKVIFLNNNAIFIYQNDEIKTVFPKHRFKKGFSIYENYYLYDSGSGIYKLQNDNTLELFIPDEKIEMNDVCGILPLFNDEILICTVNKGIFHFDGEKVMLWKETDNNYFRKNFIKTTVQLKNSNFAIGTYYDGVIIINKKGEIVEHINELKGLQDYKINALKEDHLGNLWVGLETGIDYISLSSPTRIISKKMNVTGGVFGISEYNGHFLIGTSKGLFINDKSKKENLLSPNMFIKEPIIYDNIWNLSVIDKKLFVCQSNGLIYFDETFQSKKVLCLKEGFWKVIKLKGHPELLLAGAFSGLYLLEKRDGNWVLKNKLKGFNVSSRELVQDDDGVIWVAHANKGVYSMVLNQGLDSIKEFKFYNITNKLPSNNLIRLSKIGKETLFLTEKGVYYFNKSKNHFEKNQFFNKLIGKEKRIRLLVEDNYKNVWFMTNTDFGKISFQKNGNFKVEYQPFNYIKPILVNTFEMIYFSKNNSVYIGTQKGVVCLDVSKKDLSLKPYKTIIAKVEGAKNRGDSLFYGNNLELVNKRLIGYENSNDIEIPSSFNHLRITCSSGYYSNLCDIEYKFYLDGWDDDWTDWSDKNYLDIYGLDPGEYTFRVKSRNVFGFEGEEANIILRIVKPWYLSGWFKLTITLILFIIVFFAMRFIIIKLRSNLKKQLSYEDKNSSIPSIEYKNQISNLTKELSELKNENLEYKEQIATKESSISSLTLKLNQKNELVNKIKNTTEKIYYKPNGSLNSDFNEIKKMLEKEDEKEKEWDDMEVFMTEAQSESISRIKKEFPGLTATDLKMCIYLRMKLSTKEIARLSNLSVRGIEASRYRIRKKLNLDSNTNLIDFLLKF